MQDKDLLRKQLKELQHKEMQGEESVFWKLSEEQLKFFSNFYEIEPYLYSIRTKQLNQVSKCKYKLLKEIHYSNKKVKIQIERKLSEKQRALLDEYGITYKPLKFKILLQ